MNPEQIKQTIGVFGEALDKMAQKLNQPVGKIWELALRQNYVNAITDVFYIILFIIVGVIYTKLIIKGLKNNRQGYNWFDHHDDLAFFAIPLGIVLAVLIVFFVLSGIPDIINRFINPEWQTINDLVNLVNPK